MSRREVQLTDEGRWVFNRLAGEYERRPAYPAALVDRLAELAGGPGRRVADLGAGTGHLAHPLAERGLSVSAVEPARAMLERLTHGSAHPVRSAGGAECPGHPERSAQGAESKEERGAVEPVHAAAEATGLADGAYDLVLFADSVHWVDPELAGREAGRLLRQGGVVALVEAAFAPTPFMDGLKALLAAAKPRARRGAPGADRQVLSLATRGGAVVEEHFAQAATLDPCGLEAFVRSLSFAGPALGPEALERLLSDTHRVAVHTGEARFARSLTLRWARGR